jgi:hypothetical protein
LAQVYRAFRVRDATKIPTDPGTDAASVLENILQEPLADVDADFQRWFHSVASRWFPNFESRPQLKGRQK